MKKETQNEKKVFDMWKCQECNKEMYALKYKNTNKKLLGMNIKKALCYYCNSEKVKYIGTTTPNKILN